MSTSHNNTSLHLDPISQNLQRLLQGRDFPKTICPSEVARALSEAELEAFHVTEWRHLMPEIRSRVWAMRDAGEVEIMQKGEVLRHDVRLDEVKGPIRVRKTEGDLKA